MRHEHYVYESTFSDVVEHNEQEEQKMRRIGLGDLFWFETRNVQIRLKAFYEGFYPSRHVDRWPSRSVNEGNHASLVPKQMRILDVPCPPQPDVSMVWNRLNQQKRDELRTSALSRVYARVGRVLQENRQVLDVLAYHLLKNQRMEEVEMFRLIDRLLEPNLENLTVVPDPVAMTEDVAHARHQRAVDSFAFEDSLVPPFTSGVPCDPNFGDSMDVAWDNKVALRQQYAWMAQRAAEDSLPVEDLMINPAVIWKKPKPLRVKTLIFTLCATIELFKKPVKKGNLTFKMFTFKVGLNLFQVPVHAWV